MIPIFLYSTLNQCGIQSLFYNNQVLHFIPTFCLSCGVQSLVPAFSNISKLIFNNDQALLLLVQNYDYLQTDLNSKYICVVDEELQLHQYVPMPHPNNMAAIDVLTSPEHKIAPILPDMS